MTTKHYVEKNAINMVMPTDISIARGIRRPGLRLQMEAWKPGQVDRRRNSSSAGQDYFSNAFYSPLLLLLLLSLPGSSLLLHPPTCPSTPTPSGELLFIL